MSKKEYKIEELLGATFVCACGRTHSTKFSNYVNASGAIHRIPDMLKELGYSHPYVISDTHTEAAAGAKIKKILTEAGIEYTDVVLQSPEVGDLPADENAIGSVILHYEPVCDIILSVGTGTINDTGRYFSFCIGKPFMLAATAPSMDGLVSGVAPLIRNHMKITFPAHAPLALCCDLDVMKEAPLRMLSAGAADILGKYNCLSDWKLSHIISGEYYCETLDAIMSGAIDKTMSCMASLNGRKPEDVSTLCDALTLSGIAMDFCGNSRPASGAEHHLSHYFEMQFLFDGIPAVLHGTKVGIGTVMTLRLYNELAKMERPDFAKLIAEIPNRPSFEAWEKEIRRAYRGAADSVIALEKKAGKNDPEKLKERLQSIEQHWDEIVELAAKVPQSDMVRDGLLAMDAPTRPADVGIKNEDVRDGIRYAKELRDRYTILQLLWDIDKMDDAVDLLMKEFC